MLAFEGSAGNLATKQNVGRVCIECRQTICVPINTNHNQQCAFNLHDAIAYYTCDASSGLPCRTQVFLGGSISNAFWPHPKKPNTNYCAQRIAEEIKFISESTLMESERAICIGFFVGVESEAAALARRLVIWGWWIFSRMDYGGGRGWYGSQCGLSSYKKRRFVFMIRI